MHDNTSNPAEPEGRSDAALLIRHTFEQGTVLLGTTRCDGTWPTLSGLRRNWRYSGEIPTDTEGVFGAFYIRGSRNHPAHRLVLDEAATALRKAGFSVRVEIDNTAPAMEQREEFLAEQASNRADALDAKAARQTARGQARYERGSNVVANIPLGQPLLVDHHSYPADRRRREKAHTDMEEGYAETQRGQATADRAEVAGRRMQHRENPITVANRIEKLTADRARVQRLLDGTQNPEAVFDNGRLVLDHDGKPALRLTPATGSYREDLLADAARLDDELRYWHGVRDQQIAAGTATNYGPDTIAKGDLIEAHGMEFKVVRVNPKSVTVEWFVGTHTVKYHKITGHRPAANPQRADPPPAS
jgi:hypothetical protein